jgi:ubiquinone/menaquinone biosynthesis C-methylase UbiE
MEEIQRDYLPAASHDWLLPFYDPLTKLLGIEPAHRRLLEQADIQPGHRVLEIGCGTGNLAVLTKRLHPEAKVVGLDPDPKALARARRKAEREGISVTFDRGFSDALPYPEGSFDRVLSALMFHHLLNLNDKAKTLIEARRVLAPGGSLHLLDFGGATARSDGIFSRLLHHTEQLRDNVGDRIPTLMREAGFENPAEIAIDESRSSAASRTTEGFRHVSSRDQLIRYGLSVNSRAGGRGGAKSYAVLFRRPRSGAPGTALQQAPKSPSLHTNQPTQDAHR